MAKFITLFFVFAAFMTTAYTMDVEDDDDAYEEPPEEVKPTWWTPEKWDPKMEEFFEGLF